MSRESDAEDQKWWDMVMREHLRWTVPFHVEDLKGSADAVLRAAAAESALAVAHQGAALIFGTKRHFGQGTKDIAVHAAHAGSVNDLNREQFLRSCPVCRKGQPQWSAGEVASLLSRGLAAGALLTGRADFKGLHWCTAPHEGCPGRSAEGGEAA